MIDYYTARSLGGNTRKISIMLAEGEIEHIVHFMDLARGDQHEPWYARINPHGRIPAIVDHDAPGELALGESGAILVHLAEKIGRFLPTEPRARARTLMWTFWQVGSVGPMFGQWSFFASAAKEKMPMAIDRYRTECLRLLGVLERNLEQSEFVAGDYSIADMALLSWIQPGFAAFEKVTPSNHDRWPQIERWLAAVSLRPAVALAMSRHEGSALSIGRDINQPEAPD